MSFVIHWISDTSRIELGNVISKVHTRMSKSTIYIFKISTLQKNWIYYSFLSLQENKPSLVENQNS